MKTPTIEEIKQKLTNLGLDTKQFKGLTKTQLLEELKKHYQESKTIRSTDPEWSEYVLSHLTDDELKNGHPTVDGLRRVTELLYGEILASRTVIEEIPDLRYYKCTVRHCLHIKRYYTSNDIHIDGAVDVRYNQVPAPFNEHLVATADTRAEGKALRRALKLKIITAEELDNKEEDEVINEDLINDQQILAINQMCKRLDINVQHLVQTGYGGEKCTTIKQLSHAIGKQILHDLSNYQRNLKEIPDKVKGYDMNWHKDFK